MTLLRVLLATAAMAVIAWDAWIFVDARRAGAADLALISICLLALFVIAVLIGFIWPLLILPDERRDLQSLIDHTANNKPTEEEEDDEVR